MIQTLNPPSFKPGVLSQISWRIVVQSPLGNVHAPRPMDRPYSELQIDWGGVEHSWGVCLSFGTYCREHLTAHAGQFAYEVELALAASAPHDSGGEATEVSCGYQDVS